LLTHSLGSQYELDSQNKILFIEEVGEQLYHIDRMMLQLQRAGKLQGLKALLVGHFTEVKDTATPFGKTVKEIILDHTAGYGYPILFGYPAGHHKMNLPLPIHVPIKIERKQGSCRLAYARDGNLS
jgi:muramoyltetrapeptide carboxypeptidase